jgi:RimJ/RimL family protein N-acetyltransferase
MEDPASYNPSGPSALSPPATLPTLSTSSHLHGTHISLIPLSTTHTASLYNTLNSPEHHQIFKYLPSGPYSSLSSFSNWIDTLLQSGDFMYSVIRSAPPPPSPPPSKSEQESNSNSEIIPSSETEILGIACLSATAPEHLRIEIGLILSPLLHHSTAGTEASYLLLSHCFDALGYRRVEWRCDDRNEASKRAAARLGFVKEGVFREHMVVKGWKRDTVVFGMLGREWVVVRGALGAWLGEENFDEAGRQRRRLVDLRAEMGRGDSLCV